MARWVVPPLFGATSFLDGPWSVIFLITLICDDHPGALALVLRPGQSPGLQ